MKPAPMRTLYILVGPPGCGKSMTAWDLVRRGALRITGDDFFFAMTDRKHVEWLDSGVMDCVNAAADTLMVRLMEKGLPVVVDRTHLSLRSRARCLVLAEEFGYTVEGRLWLNFGQARKRNSERTGRDQVPEVVWEKMVSAYAPPTEAEGFSQVLIEVAGDPPDL